MNETKMTRSSVLELFNLDDTDVLEATYVNINGEAGIRLTLKASYEPCPHCGTAHPKIKDYYLKKITHSVLTDRKCTLFYKVRRYECTFCHRTYAEHNPFVFGSSSISAYTVYLVLKDLKDYNETFSSVARRAHISPTTAASIFDSHVSLSRKELPEVLCFDEVYAFRHYSDKFVCVLLDFVTHKPIDFLNSRREDRLVSYFLAIPLEERKKVRICSSDMYNPYRNVMHRCFPNAYLAVDHFHVCQELNRQLDRIRIRSMKGCDSKSDKYYLLKKFNWILFKHDDATNKKGEELFAVDSNPKYNTKLKRYLNFYQIRELMISDCPELKEAWDLKEDVYSFYLDYSGGEKEKELDELIIKFRNASSNEMRHFAKTMENWRVEILNSLNVYSYTYKVKKDTGQVECHPVRVTNAIIENRNAIIKCIKKNANGYTNWERFRNRLMYVLDKDATYTLNPIIAEKKEDKS